MPAAVLLFMIGGRASPWATWTAGAWAHLQVAVSAVLSLLKGDVANAVRDFVCCRVCINKDETTLYRRSVITISGISSHKIVSHTRPFEHTMDATDDAAIEIQSSNEADDEEMQTCTGETINGTTTERSYHDMSANAEKS